MKIFLDFDDTLFNTRDYYSALKDIFGECGVPRDLFQKSYQELRSETPVKGWCYSFEIHIERLQKYIDFDEESLRKKLKSFILNTKKYLFPDVKDFLSSLQKSKHKICILSFGDVHYQTAKILGTGIAQYIEKNIITNQDKGEALRGNIDFEDSAWFFDDRIHCIESVKRIFPKIQTVLMRRIEGRFLDDRNEFCDYVAKDLIEGGRIFREHVA